MKAGIKFTVVVIALMLGACWFIDIHDKTVRAMAVGISSIVLVCAWLGIALTHEENKTKKKSGPWMD